MRGTRLRCAFVIFALLLGASNGFADETPPSRINPTVRAVQKIKPSVVAIKTPTASGKDTTGSGVIIDERGFVITNRHVIGSARTVKVMLLDRTEFVGKVLVADASTDLAVIKIEPGKKKLAAQVLAPSTDLYEGEDVIAVGHPYGYSFSVTKGIISAVGREIEMPSGYTLTDLIQTSAPINPGNSGGPLVNINGEMIGINVALRDGAQCIGFTITTETVKRVLGKHLSAYKVAGVTHGLKTTEKVTAETGDRQKVILASVEGQPGLKKGDILLCVGQQKVVNSFDVERALWDARPGQQVTVRLLRDNQEVTTTLALTPATKAVAVNR